MTTTETRFAETARDKPDVEGFISALERDCMGTGNLISTDDDTVTGCALGGLYIHAPGLSVEQVDERVAFLKKVGNEPPAYEAIARSLRDDYHFTEAQAYGLAGPAIFHFNDALQTPRMRRIVIGYMMRLVAKDVSVTDAISQTLVAHWTAMLADTKDAVHFAAFRVGLTRGLEQAQAAIHRQMERGGVVDGRAPRGA